VTRHCLIRSDLADVVRAASQLHGKDVDEAGAATTDSLHWRYAPGTAPDKTVRWRSRVVDGSVVSWCLEVEQGANGVLAHLSASALGGPVARLPRRLRCLTLQAWSARELAGLAEAINPSAERWARPRY